MAQIIDLQRSRERRAERFIESAGELRGEMAGLCADLQHALGQLREAREAVDRARTQIEASRTRMRRIQVAATGRTEPARPPRLRLVRA